MKKLNLDTLVVESFATVGPMPHVRGTVEAQQLLPSWSCQITCASCPNTCLHTCDDPTCAPSCRYTDCAAECYGASELTAADCGGGGTGGGGGGTGGGGGGTGTDYIGCTNVCTTGMTST